MRIEIDESRCIAAGTCVLAAEELFDQRDEDGVVVVLDAHPATADLEHKAREAESVCPAKVITIHEE